MTTHTTNTTHNTHAPVDVSLERFRRRAHGPATPCRSAAWRGRPRTTRGLEAALRAERLRACTVRVEDEEFQIPGGEGAFDGVADFVYAPRDARAQIASGAGGRFALAGAKCERRLPARYGPAPEVPDTQADH
ncbi:hypothetical protein GCM10023083_62320 [Streptomyces phyllanthi]